MAVPLQGGHGLLPGSAAPLISGLAALGSRPPPHAVDISPVPGPGPRGSGRDLGGLERSPGGHLLDLESLGLGGGGGPLGGGDQSLERSVTLARAGGDLGRLCKRYIDIR